MRYDQSVQQSAEILRLVLPHLPRHSAAYHPISYALWYEYNAGINPPLKARMDALQAEGSRIDDAMAYELYREYILDAWSSRSLSVNHQLEGLVSTFEQSAERACADAENFSESWGEFQQRLLEAPPELREQIAADLVASGLRMRGRVNELRTELQASVDETRQLRRELHRLHSEVLTDPLTGLCNRRGLDPAFAEIHRRAMETGGTCSTILIDVDHFKRVNDNYGHSFGDAVLKNVAATLRRRARSEDVVARLGGEEFLIVLPDTTTEAARQLAEDMRSTVERGELRQRGSQEVIAKITISAGVTGMRAQDTPANMITRADSAMYRAKSRGRNQVAVLA
jgi:diguanylate cyclase